MKVHDRHEAHQDPEEPGASGPAHSASQAASDPPSKSEPDDPERRFVVSGYVETFYQYNFNNPGNGISNYRGYDDRHNTLSLQNAVVDVGFRAKNILGRVALQVGRTGASMYGQETRLPGTDAAGETSPEVWRYLQRATVGWQATDAVLIEGGVFPTNVGLESIAVKDNWNWSRSHMSTRLPNYFTGAKVTVSATKQLDLTATVTNGWNRVVDDNDEKSGVLQAIYRVKDRFTGSLSYIGGVEREGGAPEGRAWRHTADAWMQVKIVSPLSVGADTLAGGEHTRYGFQWYAGAALYGRVHVLDPLWFALRADRLWEDNAADARGASRAILIPAKYVTSLAATLDYRPVNGVSLRLEGRHDMAESDLYFRSRVVGDGSAAAPYLTNARTQTTVLAGLVAWF